MKYKQIELMKVIEFPKNRQMGLKKRNKKLNVAIELLQYLVNGGADFHIVISKEQAEKLYDGDLRKYTVITSNLEEAKNLNISSNNYSIYPIEGDEL